MRILIVKMSSMGDIIHTLPALTDAQKQIPNIAFDWLIEESFAEIPTWHSAVSKVIPISLRKWRKKPLTLLANFWHLRKKLGAQKYDLIIDAQGLIKSALIARFARGIHCGYDKNSAKEKLANMFYKRHFTVEQNQHAIARIRELFAKALGYDIPNTAPDYGIKNHFAEISPQNYLVFLHSTARSEKLWPENNWIELAKIANKYQIKLPWGSSQEYERAIRINAATNNTEILPKMNLTDLLKTLREAKAVVAVDTGLGHLCAAFNIPTISIYINTDPKLIGTVGTNQIHLMGNISVNELWNALQQLLASQSY